LVKPLVNAVAGVTILTALTACAASHPSGVGFHSPTGHYTVKQVEEAFAAQAIDLRAREIPVLGRRYVALDPPGALSVRHPAHALAVLVENSEKQPQLPGDSLLTRGVQLEQRGNVWVIFGAARASAAKSARARLL
jgi:hypothetical protein